MSRQPPTLEIICLWSVETNLLRTHQWKLQFHMFAMWSLDAVQTLLCLSGSIKNDNDCRLLISHQRAVLLSIFCKRKKKNTQGIVGNKRKGKKAEEPKLSLIEGQASLLAVWAIFPLSHSPSISTSDITKKWSPVRGISLALAGAKNNKP